MKPSLRRVCAELARGLCTLDLCLALTGCCSPQMLLVNNTGYDITVTVQNAPLFKNVHPGQTVAIPPAHYCDRTAVAVTGWNGDGDYVGADDWIFYNGQAQVWRVDHLNQPTK